MIWSIEYWYLSPVNRRWCPYISKYSWAISKILEGKHWIWYLYMNTTSCLLHRNACRNGQRWHVCQCFLDMVCYGTLHAITYGTLAACFCIGSQGSEGFDTDIHVHKYNLATRYNTRNIHNHRSTLRESLEVVYRRYQTITIMINAFVLLTNLPQYVLWYHNRLHYR